MKTLVLSHALSNETPLYGGERNIRFKQDRKIKRGDSCNRSQMHLPAHAGTHVDAPYHFLPRGKQVLDYPPASWLFFNICLWSLPLSAGEQLAQAHLQSAPGGKMAEVLLMKTGFEALRDKRVYWEHSPIIPASTARAILKRFPRLKVIGFDLISLSSQLNRSEGRAAHQVFLRKGIRIVEDMKLSCLKAQPDFLLISPLWAMGLDGAPVTAWAFYPPFCWEQTEALFFDLDGVLLQSVQIKADAFAALYKPFGGSIAKKVVQHHLHHGGVSRFEKIRHYHEAFLDTKLSKKEINIWARRFQKMVFEKVKRAPEVRGARRMLEEAKKRRIPCFVVTGTPEREARLILKSKNLLKYFRAVAGSPGSKIYLIEKLLQRFRLLPQKSFFFGDSVTDLEAANANGLRFIGINYDPSPRQFPHFSALLSETEKKAS